MLFVYSRNTWYFMRKKPLETVISSKSQEFHKKIYVYIYTYLAGTLVYLTAVESYSHFFTLINMITCSIQYIQTNGRLKRLKKSSEGETKTLGNFDSSYCTLLLKTSPKFILSTHLWWEKKRYIYLIYIFKLRRF